MRYLMGALVGAVVAVTALFVFLLRKLEADLAGIRTL